jgi:hypothetical protein
VAFLLLPPAFRSTQTDKVTRLIQDFTHDP